MPNIDRDDENATRYEMPKPDIDEQIARQKHVIDLHEAGLLEPTPSAQQAYDTDKAILATLEAHKRIIEAAEVPEPVAYSVIGVGQDDEDEQLLFLAKEIDFAEKYAKDHGVPVTPLYGPDLLAAYHKALAQHKELRRKYAARWIEFSKMHERAETAERQLAELREKQERLNKNIMEDFG